MFPRALKLLILLLILVAPLESPYTKDKNSIYAAVTKGSVWTLLKDLKIDPQRSSVYIQNGEIKPSEKDGDRYQTYCTVDFKMKLQDTPRIIKPSEFTVTSVSHDREPLDDVMVIYKNRMKLTSERYPDIMWIICQVWGDRSDDYPTIEQMKKTLTGYFELRLKEK